MPHSATALLRDSWDPTTGIAVTQWGKGAVCAPPVVKPPNRRIRLPESTDEIFRLMPFATATMPEVVRVWQDQQHDHSKISADRSQWSMPSAKQPDEQANHKIRDHV